MLGYFQHILNIAIKNGDEKTRCGLVLPYVLYARVMIFCYNVRQFMSNIQPLWYNSIKFKALMLFCLMLLVVFIAISYVLNTTGKDIVHHSAEQRVQAHVELVAQRLSQQTDNIQSVAKSLAGILNENDSVKDIEQKILAILTNDGLQGIVASGGFWPEPYTLNPTQAKASVFISFDENGHYQKIDDYNFATARPYHIEEWYAPARFFKKNVYWSRAYIDPYTKEAMVTLSTPVYFKSIFSGVVTIDVKLDKIQTYLQLSGHEFSGYFIAFDRVGRMMSYPENAIENTNDLSLLPQISSLVDNNPQFSTLALITNYAKQFAYFNRSSDPTLFSLATQLVSTSSDIDLSFAFSIAKQLVEEKPFFSKPAPVFIHHLENDPILKERSIVFGQNLRDTHWLLVGVLPERLLLLEATELKNDLFFGMILIALLLMSVSYAAIYLYIVKPMVKVRETLMEKNEPYVPLNSVYFHQKDELGMLINEFNQLGSYLIQTKEFALEAIHAKQLFLAHISHEIRTPLNGILGATALMQEDSMSTKQAEYLSVIGHSSRRLMSIVNNILDFNQIDSSYLELKNEVFSLDKVGQYVYDLMLPTIYHKPKLRFNYQFDLACPKWVIGDAHRLEQIILNLISNALKFTDKGEVILSIKGQRFSLQYLDIIIAVSDTGVGIALDKLHSIFDKFKQADLATKHQFGSSGLGLAVTQQLVNLMKGEIQVSSDVGLGSRFEVHIRLPLAQTKKNNLSQIAKSRVNKFSNKRCLFVEDNVINLMVGEKLLSKLGFIVDKAVDGLQAIEKTKQQIYDIILMDIQMPHMDGLEATRQIRADDNLNKITPIIAMTANEFKQDMWRCINNGMQGHINKPLYENEMVIICNQILVKEQQVNFVEQN